MDENSDYQGFVDFGEKVTRRKLPEIREFLTRMEESRWQTFVRRRIGPLLRKLRIKGAGLPGPPSGGGGDGGKTKEERYENN